jgi:hypothetical protein
MSLLVDLLTDAIELSDGVRVKNAREVVNVIRRLELRYRFGAEKERQREDQNHRQSDFRA